MTDTNPAKFKKLVTLLRELFQLDQPDLDFGIYRIMHAKAGEVTRFLEQDLLPQVKEAFAQYQSADSAELRKKLDQMVAQLTEAGVDPETAPKVKELREQLEGAIDIGALENETYDHLYSFFRRYYSEGDFLTKRVYKPGVYAIPYEGEEVTLHWANKDQYYIKTSEYLREYAFRLKPDAREGEDPMRVRFKLVDAAEGEHGNVKAAEGKDRVFVLAADDFIALQDGELELRFEYRPATLEDWPADQRDGKKKPPAQKDLITQAAGRVLAAGAEFGDWLVELGKSHTKADGEQADYNRLEAHLRRYTARNTFDYFIHKDLDGFLRRELDFYIKNEVMHLDDVESETAPKVEQYLSKIKVIRRIAGKIIDFLAQLENFQKKLWLKKKFVVASDWLVAISQVPDEFLPEICANTAQIEEWKQLYSLHELPADDTGPAYSEPLTPEYLRAHPSLMLDTRYLDSGLVSRLLEAVEDLDEKTDGVLVHSENFQALSLMRARYREKVQCIYIDPPYNTGNDGFPYKDNYQHSSWASMIADRIALAPSFMTKDGAFFASIDEVEQPNLKLIADTTFGPENRVADLVWAAGRKNDSRLISVSHEYILTYVRSREHLIAGKTEWRQRKQGLDEIYAQYRRLKREHGDDYAAMTAGLKEWYRSLSDGDPSKAHRHYNQIDARGIYFPADISWPGGGGPRYEVLHPRTGRPVRVPSRGWMTSDPEKMRQWIAEDRVHFGEDESAVPCIKSYLVDREFQAPYSVFYQDGRAATKRLRHVLGNAEFGYPKDEGVVGELISMLPEVEICMDYFAGSGTTAHSVINLNREDGGNRKFALVEMSGYFESILLPRLKKIVFTPEWKDGKPNRLATRSESERSPRLIKVLRLESYEDTLNNLALSRSSQQQAALDFHAVQGAGGLREDYLLRYQLDVESRGSASLLNIAAFSDPTAYKLLVKTPGSDESREVNVDLLETFNWLLGLTVQHIAAPRSFIAGFKRDDQGRLQISGRLKQDPTGPWWFRTVTGTTPEGRRTLVIWRKLTGDAEQDNLVLETWFRDKQAFSVRDTEFDLIYVNGDNTLENLRLPDETWKVRLTEEDFQRLMFEGTE